MMIACYHNDDRSFRIQHLDIINRVREAHRHVREIVKHRERANFTCH